MITKEYLQQELRRRIEGIKPGIETTTDNIIAEMESILVLVDALNDYEKKYNEALERAKAYHRNELAGTRQEMTEYIFPQLRESEDERIAEELIKALRGMSTGLQYAIFLTEKKKQRWISWLEKQKEQKPAGSEEDETIIEGACSALEIYGHNKLASKLKSLRPSWKPSEEQMGALRRAVNKLAKTYVADSVRLSTMYDNLKKL